MKMENGFVYMTKQEICDNNLGQRIKMVLSTYGPLEAKQMAYIVVSATFGERVSRINRMCYRLRDRGEIISEDGKWRMV